MPLPDRPFNIVAIGDSVMWGQGLRPEHKFTRLVSQRLETILDHEIRINEDLPHSGAHITPASDPILEERFRTMPGEVPRPYPSIVKQAEIARSVFGTPEEVDLILVDGGIDDMHGPKIVDPTVDPDWVRRQAEMYCRGSMENLLRELLAQFTNARIVVTGYFPLISEQTPLFALPQTLVAVAIMLASPPFALISLILLRRQLAEQSQAWWEQSNQSLQAAIRAVNPLFRSARRGTGGDPWEGYPPPPPAPAPTTLPDPGRVLFAGVRFKPENCYAADDTLLWKIEPDPGPHLIPWKTDDEVREDRERGCVASAADLPAEDAPMCKLSAAFHPNRECADLYADSVVSAVLRFLQHWDTWKPRSGSPASPAGTLDVSFAPGFEPIIFVGPDTRFRQAQPSKVKVIAVDRATGEEVKRPVLINRKVAGFSGDDFIYTFRCMKARGEETICPIVMVVSDDYQFAVLEY
jgi:hypothetical protein